MKDKFSPISVACFEAEAISGFFKDFQLYNIVSSAIIAITSFPHFPPLQTPSINLYSHSNYLLACWLSEFHLSS